MAYASLVNPAGKPKKAGSKKKYNRNPAGLSAIGKNLGQNLQRSAYQAGGALVTDFVYANLPIPEEYKTGYWKPLAKSGIAIIGGAILESFVKGSGRMMLRHGIEGTLTVGMYTAGKMAVAEYFPDLRLDGLGDYTPLRSSSRRTRTITRGMGVPTPGGAEVLTFDRARASMAGMGVPTALAGPDMRSALPMRGRRSTANQHGY